MHLTGLKLTKVDLNIGTNSSSFNNHWLPKLVRKYRCKPKMDKQ